LTSGGFRIVSDTLVTDRQTDRQTDRHANHS